MPTDPFVRNESGDIVARKIPQDTRGRLVIEPGTLGWESFINENWVSTVAQLNALESRYTKLKAKLDETQRRLRAESRPYDFSQFVPGRPDHDKVVLRQVIPPNRVVTIPEGKAGHLSTAVAPSQTLQLPIRVDGAWVGQAALSAGQIKGNVFFEDTIHLEGGSVLVIGAIGYQDQTLEDLAISIEAASVHTA